MAKAKKRNPGRHHPRFDPADQKKHFYSKLRSICEAAAGQGIFELIPAKDLRRMYHLRMLPFRIEPAAGEAIPRDVLKEMRRSLSDYLNDVHVPLFIGGPTIPLADYLFAVTSLRYHFRDLRKSAFPRADKFIEAMAPVISYEEGLAAADEKLSDIMVALEFTFSDPASRLFYLYRRYGCREHGTMGVVGVLGLRMYIPERASSVLEGVPRPAIRLCWGSHIYKGILKVRIKPSDLGVRSPCDDEPLNVYVQMHALKRLSERLDCIPAGARNMYLCLSFAKPHALPGKNGAFLLEYNLRGLKAGYLVGSICDGKFLVRTFLFLTNDGTPEGECLARVSGIGRLEREFLAIDRLSTFVANDIRSDGEVAKVFVEAGCECLLELHDAVRGINTKEGMASAMPLLKKYLGAENRNALPTPETADEVKWRS